MENVEILMAVQYNNFYLRTGHAAGKLLPRDSLQDTVLGDVSAMGITGFLQKIKQYLLAQNSEERKLNADTLQVKLMTP